MTTQTRTRLPKIVSRTEWLESHEKMLAKEKKVPGGARIRRSGWTS